MSIVHYLNTFIEGIKEQIKADEIILEGEAIAYNAASGEFLPFQETAQRKRKYDVDEKAKEIPLKLICFEVLLIDGQNYIPEALYAIASPSRIISSALICSLIPSIISGNIAVASSKLRVYIFTSPSFLFLL